MTTQARLDCEKSRSSWIEGRATFTIVWSRMIMRKPAHRTSSAIQRWRSGADGAAGGGGAATVLVMDPTVADGSVRNDLLTDDYCCEAFRGARRRGICEHSTGSH